MRPPQRGAPLAIHVLAVAALTVGLLTGALACAGAAWAHAARIGSDPAENAVLAQAPQRVHATFSEPMRAQFAAMTVIGPDGNQWSDGEPAVNGAVISVGVRSGGPAGSYTVNYRATSADGHVVSGSWTFTVTAAGTADPAAPTSAVAASPPARPTDPGDGLPVWPFAVAAAAAVAAGALWAVRRGS